MTSGDSNLAPTDVRPSIIVLKSEGDRVGVPEGGEIVCCRSIENQKLYMKIEYSREIILQLSSSILSKQRPKHFAELLDSHPELVAAPPESRLPVEPQTTSPRHVSILSQPLIGPITEVDSNVAAIHMNHIMKPKTERSDVVYSPSGFPLRFKNAYSPETSQTFSLTEM